MKTLLTTILLIYIQVNSSLACTCLKLKKLSKDEINSKDVVFIGTILSVEYLDEYKMKTIFSIEEALSNVDGLKTYEVWSVRACPPSFELGHLWYIFGEFQENKHWSGLCGRSAKLTDRLIQPNDFNYKFRKQIRSGSIKNQKRANREIKFIRKLKGVHPKWKPTWRVLNL